MIRDETVFILILNVAALNTGGKQADFSLKWVDDTHALAVYSNTSAGKVLNWTNG